MAGISYYRQGVALEVVTLTTQFNHLCALYHHRMPVLIKPENIKLWFRQNFSELQKLMLPLEQDLLVVSAA